MMDKVKRWWKTFRMDPNTRYLSEAVDHVDLEQRLKKLQRQGIWV